MDVSYVIQWKSKTNGRSGRGTKQFSFTEAERLAAELNREYPQIEHSAIPASPAEPEPRPTENQPQEGVPGEEASLAHARG